MSLPLYVPLSTSLPAQSDAERREAELLNSVEARERSGYEPLREAQTVVAVEGGGVQSARGGGGVSNLCTTGDGTGCTPLREGARDSRLRALT